jgi:phage regulator Rha-like protein
MATKFNKRHADVIRLIQTDIEAFEEFSRQRNIALSSYQVPNPNSDNKFLERKMYLLDKDAFMFFAMKLDKEFELDVLYHYVNTRMLNTEIKEEI